MKRRLLYENKKTGQKIYLSEVTVIILAIAVIGLSYIVLYSPAIVKLSGGIGVIFAGSWIKRQLGLGDKKGEKEEPDEQLNEE